MADIIIEFIIISWAAYDGVDNCVVGCSMIFNHVDRMAISDNKNNDNGIAIVLAILWTVFIYIYIYISVLSIIRLRPKSGELSSNIRSELYVWWYIDIVQVRPMLALLLSDLVNVQGLPNKASALLL